MPVFNLNKYKGGFHEQAYNQRKKPFGSLAARTLGDLYADTAQGAKNGIELSFDTLLKGRDGITPSPEGDEQIPEHRGHSSRGRLRHHINS